MHSTKVLTNWLPIIGSADSQEKKQILGLLQFNTVIVIVNFDAYLRVSSYNFIYISTQLFPKCLASKIPSVKQSPALTWLAWLGKACVLAPSASVDLDTCLLVL